MLRHNLFHIGTADAHDPATSASGGRRQRHDRVIQLQSHVGNVAEALRDSDQKSAAIRRQWDISERDVVFSLQRQHLAHFGRRGDFE